MWTYQAEPLRVVDADTLHVRVDLGFKIHHDVIVRLAGLNAPELRTPDGNAALDYTARWLNDHPGPVTIRTIKDRVDPYGRYLATVTSGADELNAGLLLTGHAVPYPPARA